MILDATLISTTPDNVNDHTSTQSNTMMQLYNLGFKDIRRIYGNGARTHTWRVNVATSEEEMLLTLKCAGISYSYQNRLLQQLADEEKIIQDATAKIADIKKQLNGGK